MIVGADAATNRDIVTRAAALYDRHRLRRVYYSAFSPIPDASAVLPLKREHRLYQSDWMMRFYGYQPQEVAAAADPATGMMPLEIDPKLAWALRFRGAFPVDVNRAPREALPAGGHGQGRAPRYPQDAGVSSLPRGGGRRRGPALRRLVRARSSHPAGQCRLLRPPVRRDALVDPDARRDAIS